MKTIFFLTLLLMVPCLAIADQNTLAYLYEPVLGEGQQSMVQRIKLHAWNAEFDAAISLSQDLLDSADPLRDADPSIYGQVMINHGILRVAAGEYQLGLAIIERGMEFLEARTNPFDEILINSVMAKGICQLLLGSFTNAEDTFRRAQHITHRHKGVYNKEQLPMISYLTATNLRQGNSLAADQQQRFSLKVAEQSYGPNSIEILPTLVRLGSYFASRGNTIPVVAPTELRLLRNILFRDSINLYLRAIEITELNYGVNDLRLLTPLRGLASARMLEITQRRNAKVALLRSLEIVDSNLNSDLTDRAQAMVDLGDFYIITSDKQAQEIYLNAWAILQETPETQRLAASLFGSPVRLYPRDSPFLYLDRTPDGHTTGDELFANLQFDVLPNGHVQAIEIIDNNVPNKGIRLVRQILRASRYRPRIHNGELVSTEALQKRQLFAVLYNKPLPDDKQEEADTAVGEVLLLEAIPAEEEEEADTAVEEVLLLEAIPTEAMNEA
jgi:tetratricopeptide (TPR) repeat protein